MKRVEGQSPWGRHPCLPFLFPTKNSRQGCLLHLTACLITAVFVLSCSAIPAIAAPQVDDGPAQAKPTDLAYNNGYQAGFKLGQADKKSGQKQDFAQASAYRRATDGWKEGVSGELEAYRTNYRAGFADGYKDGLGEAPEHHDPPAAERPAEERRAD